MYVIMESSTDQMRPNYKIKFTNSNAEVKKALGTEATHTYDNPKEARNWHNTFVEVYEMPSGWRKPSKKKIEDEVFRRRGSVYSPNAKEVMAKIVKREGTQIESI